MLILIDNKVDTSDSTNGDEQDEEMPETNEMPPNNLSENMNKIFHQMQEQSLAMTSTVLINNELSEDIIFMIDLEELQIKVTKISSDGNCLFGAVAHQLYHIKVDSHEHIEKNAALRSCVVAHIKKTSVDMSTLYRDAFWMRMKIFTMGNERNSLRSDA